ncbi:MAG: helix-hairpin-helix domain-containing protein [Cellulomonadaceae bacterium]|nr:helix-hairpin-helix domain-containing protein [Cellulomonadaceae bacterium]
MQYRQVNGDFTSINQLQEVKGIGPAVMSSITELITV